jgi:predicted Fe-Mo cluster-binding NifX family protein
VRIAVAYENGEIYGHFGHCPMFAVYEYGEYVNECEKKLVDTSAL